jgi:hypothetical protein
MHPTSNKNQELITNMKKRTKLMTENSDNQHKINADLTARPINIPIEENSLINNNALNNNIHQIIKQNQKEENINNKLDDFEQQNYGASYTENIKEIGLELSKECDNLNTVKDFVIRLLKDDVTVIDEIFEYSKTVKKTEKEISKELKKIIKDSKANPININDTKRFHESLETINYLCFKKDLLFDKAKYLKEIRKNISFKLVDTISKDKVKEVNKFFETYDTNTYGKVKVKNIDKKTKK